MRRSIAFWLALMALPAPTLAAEISITVRDDNGPVPGVVVALTGKEAVPPVTTEIYQKDRRFHPKILIVPVGSTVDFPNRDNTQHHVYSFSPAKTFDLKLYAGRPEAPVVFDKPGIVELGCNIHDQMQAFVIVTNTSDIGRTDKNGQITLSAETEDVDGQTVAIKLWHPRLPDNTRPEIRKITLGNPANLHIRLTPEPTGDDSLERLQQRFREL